MPKHRNPFDKGSLLIEFDVELPTSLRPDALATLAKACRGRLAGVCCVSQRTVSSHVGGRAWLWEYDVREELRSPMVLLGAPYDDVADTGNGNSVRVLTDRYPKTG